MRHVSVTVCAALGARASAFLTAERLYPRARARVFSWAGGRSGGAMSFNIKYIH